MKSLRWSIKAALLSLRDLLLAAGPSVLLVVALVALAFWWLKPNPPKRLVLATGPAHSAYAAFGQRYATALARSGIELVLHPSQGSADNLALLRSGEADLGFVQGGSVALTGADREELLSLGSLFVEPLWVFYRESSALRLTGVSRIEYLKQMRGWRVNVGTPGSGMPQLFSDILATNRLSGQDFLLSNEDQTPATVAFLNGQLDAVVFAFAPESSMVQMLLKTPGVRLLAFAQSQAYGRRLPYLKPVLLPRGVVDLASNLPMRDVPLVAPTSGLVARVGTHPAVLQLMAQTATELHRSPGWFNGARDFPNLENSELPVAPEAARALVGNAPFLQRYLPFWLANLVERMWLALGLILALALPLSRVVPPLYTLRIRSRVFRWYAELRDIELRAETQLRPAPATDRAPAPRPGTAPAPATVAAAGASPVLSAPASAPASTPARLQWQALMRELDELEAKAGQMVVPLAYADELYALRSHIQLVRKKLTRQVLGDRTDPLVPTDPHF